jgi:hypothetical protein
MRAIVIHDRNSRWYVALTAVLLFSHLDSSVVRQAGAMTGIPGISARRSIMVMTSCAEWYRRWRLLRLGWLASNHCVAPLDGHIRKRTITATAM